MTALEFDPSFRPPEYACEVCGDWARPRVVDDELRLRCTGHAPGLPPYRKPAWQASRTRFTGNATERAQAESDEMEEREERR